jgi:hypothetical protein
MLEPPVFQIIPNNKVRLLKDWQITETLIIPCGYESDLGSVPRFFWWFLHPNDITYSSIIHDYEWEMADLGKYSFFAGNKSFLKNSIKLDKIQKYKAYICYSALEVVRIYKFFKFKHN